MFQGGGIKNVVEQKSSLLTIDHYNGHLKLRLLSSFSKKLSD